MSIACSLRRIIVVVDEYHSVYNPDDNHCYLHDVCLPCLF
uniref:Uncharacterized protein n=1 Tax=Arundo donax TaxID=35708 RepID=A0A0A8ZYM7_ARUDO